jgi:hypothetical protein
MKQGRPRNLLKSKNRKHIVVLSETAENVFRNVSKARIGSWFSKYVSEKIIQDFLVSPETLLIDKMSKLDAESKRIENEKQKVAEELRKIRNGGNTT